MFTGVGACELVSVGLSGGIEVHAFFFFFCFCACRQYRLVQSSCHEETERADYRLLSNPNDPRYDKQGLPGMSSYGF